MRRKDALKSLAEHLEQGYQEGMRFHPRFFEELRDLLKNASGYEKEILNLLVRQLGYVREFRRKVNEADGNETQYKRLLFIAFKGKRLQSTIFNGISSG